MGLSYIRVVPNVIDMNYNTLPTDARHTGCPVRPGRAQPLRAVLLACSHLYCLLLP
jgi:hypothetical protein